MVIISTKAVISIKKQLKNNFNLNIGKNLNTKMSQITFFCIILLLNYISCTVAAGSNIGGGVSVADAKNLIANQDARMLPAEVYPWNILGVPDYSIENEMSKRSSWQKLHGTWGKRNILENGGGYHGNNIENFDDTNNGLVGGSSGPGGNNNDQTGDNEIDLHENPTDRDYQELIKFEEIYSLPSSIINDLLKPTPLYNEKKRAWRNLNVAWGKRRPNNEWNKFRGAWGKREPGWNNLKGLWGKRASNWNKLNSAWGKRSSEDVMEN